MAPYFLERLRTMANVWQELVPIDQFIVSAEGLLHEYDRKVLTFLYQPLIGSACFSLYMTMWAESENKWSKEPSSHHLLMNLLAMNLDAIYEARLKLEGIGLLKTYVKTLDENRLFIYELRPPLLPDDFFKDGMLNVYLYQTIGKKRFSRLKRFFSVQETQKDEFTEVTKSFQDVFGSAASGNLQKQQMSKPDDLHQFIGRKEAKPIQISPSVFNFELLMAGLNESLIPKKAISQKVRDAISNLAFLYDIDAIQMKKFLLDAFNPSEDEIDIEELRKAARNWYQFVNYDELPSLIERKQPIRYQVQLEEPKTPEEKLIRYFEISSPLKVLTDHSNGGEPSEADLKLVEGLMINQKLTPGVVNVLIDYVMLKLDKKLTKNYVEKIGSQWARKNVKTVREAMELAKMENQSSKEAKNKPQYANRKPIRTELLPDWFDEEPKPAASTASAKNDQDLQAQKREIEDILKELRK